MVFPLVVGYITSDLAARSESGTVGTTSGYHRAVAITRLRLDWNHLLNVVIVLPLRRLWDSYHGRGGAAD